MKNTFTRNEFLSNGVFDTWRIPDSGVIDMETITLSDILQFDFMGDDEKLCTIARMCELTPIEIKRLSLNLAWVVLPIYEEFKPEGTSVRHCLESVENWIIGEETDDDVIQQYNAMLSLNNSINKTNIYSYHGVDKVHEVMSRGDMLCDAVVRAVAGVVLNYIKSKDGTTGTFWDWSMYAMCAHGLLFTDSNYETKYNEAIEKFIV